MKSFWLCKHCNNSNKMGSKYYCLGGKKEDIKKFEHDARELKIQVDAYKFQLSLYPKEF